MAAAKFFCFQIKDFEIRTGLLSNFISDSRLNYVLHASAHKKPVYNNSFILYDCYDRLIMKIFCLVKNCLRNSQNYTKMFIVISRPFPYHSFAG